MSDHPTYPNPTIREALCEIHFVLPAEREWSSKIFGQFFKEVQDEFPQLEPSHQDASIKLQAGPEGVMHQLVPPRQRMRYINPDTNLLIQLSEGIFTVNVLPVYPGWAFMRDNMLRLWEKANKLLTPINISRIGLRYINFIPRKTLDEKPGDWLQQSSYIPGMVLSSLPGFLSRTEVKVSVERRLIVTLAESTGQPPPIVFDIDCIVEKDIPVCNDLIINELESLHDTEWDIFKSSINQRLEALLQEV